MTIKEISVCLGKKVSKDFNSWEIRFGVTAALEPGEDHMAKYDELMHQLREKVCQGLKVPPNGHNPEGRP